MMVYGVAAVTDCGDYYEVEYVSSSLSQDFEKHNKFLGLSQTADEAIQTALNDGKIVRIVSDYTGPDVQGRDLIIIDRDVTELDSNKEISLKRVRQYVSHLQANVSGLMMYQYININNTLCDKGFYIHDDNKEEIYLKILETEDELLIDKLEEYLNAREVIARSSFLEDRYMKYYRDIKDASSEEEVEKLFATFMKMIVEVSK